MRTEPLSWRDTVAPTLALFGSGATLVCCALPALFVSLGLGAALAGLVSAAPQLVWLSAHKGLVFGASGALIALASWMQWRARSAPCPADPAAAAACRRLRAASTVILGVSIVAWSIGAFFAFFAARLLL